MGPFKKYEIDQAFRDGLWYLWQDGVEVKIGDFEDVLEEIRKREATDGTAD